MVGRGAARCTGRDPADPLGVLAAVGGLEHAALAGFVLGAAAPRVPVLLDGVIAGAAALVAAALAPDAVGDCIAGHRSAEPGQRVALAHLGLHAAARPGLRLGEGTGAALALPLRAGGGAGAARRGHLRRARASRGRNAESGHRWVRLRLDNTAPSGWSARVTTSYADLVREPPRGRVDGAVVAEIRALVPDGVISHPAQLRTYACDGLTGYRVMPAPVVLPATTARSRRCSDLPRGGVPFVARGAGTGLSGGALPVAEGIVIGVPRLRGCWRSTRSTGAPWCSPASRTSRCPRPPPRAATTTRPTPPASRSARSAATSRRTPAARTA